MSPSDSQEVPVLSRGASVSQRTSSSTRGAGYPWRKLLQEIMGARVGASGWDPLGKGTATAPLPSPTRYPTPLPQQAAAEGEPCTYPRVGSRQSVAPGPSPEDGALPASSWNQDQGADAVKLPCFATSSGSCPLLRMGRPPTLLHPRRTDLFRRRRRARAKRGQSGPHACRHKGFASRLDS